MVFELEVERVAYPGNGMGFHQGKAVFVPCTIAGDRVLVEVKKEKRNHIIGHALRLLHASTERVTPPCPHYEHCGGCDLMHIPLKAQTQLKATLLTSLLEESGISTPIQFVESPADRRFRHRALFQADDGTLGFSQRNSHLVTAVPHCFVVAESILKTIPRLQPPRGKKISYQLLASNVDNQVAVTVIAGKRVKTQPGFPGTVKTDYGQGSLTLQSRDFAQSSPQVTAMILERILKICEKSDRVTELYCGSGTFSLPLAKQVDQLWGYELSHTALEAAASNAKEWGVSNISWIQGNLDRIKVERDVDTILCDPPRTGLDSMVLDQIQDSDCGLLVYVSCNPATQVRDMVALKERGGFLVDEFFAFDMYPHTTHLETLAVLRR